MTSDCGEMTSEQPRHCFRRTIFARERCYTLDDAALVCSEDGSEHRVPLSEILRIHIYRVPASMGPAIRRTVLHLRSGKRVVLQSNHYVRLAVIQDRADTYRYLVTNLLQRIARYSFEPEITLGAPGALWITWLVLFVASCIVLAAGLLIFVAGDFPIGAVLSFGIVVGFLPLAWRMLRAGRAHRTDVRSVPADALE